MKKTTKVNNLGASPETLKNETKQRAVKVEASFEASEPTGIKKIKIMKTTKAVKNGRNQVKNTASNTKLELQGEPEVCKEPERVDIVDPKSLTIPEEFDDEIVFGGSEDDDDLIDPKSLKISGEFVHQIFFWDTGNNDGAIDLFERVHSAALTASKLKASLSKSKNEMESLKKTESIITAGMTSKGAIFWKDADNHSRDLFPESYALVRRLEATLEQEIERLDNAQNVEIVMKALQKKAGIHNGWSRDLAIIDIIQETGLPFETIVTIVNDLNAVSEKNQLTICDI